MKGSFGGVSSFFCSTRKITTALHDYSCTKNASGAFCDVFAVLDMVLYGLGVKNALKASQAVREMGVMVNGVIFGLCS